jgi:hypothetical protein
MYVDGEDAEITLSREEELIGHEFGIVRTKLFRSRRIFRQMGCFTYIGVNEDLESYQSRHSEKGIVLKKYDISSGNWRSILRELRYMGITSGNLFDDLDGVARDVTLGVLTQRVARRR